KNRSSLFVLALLFTIGVNGVLSGLTNGSHYIGRDYADTPGVQNELKLLVDLLTLFEFELVTEEEARKQLVVTKQEIDEHRYRYGDLDSQLSSIRQQYEHGILEAVAEGDEAKKDELVAERDAKLSDIRLNFESDEHVGAKVRKEKEADLVRYFGELERYRSQFYELRRTFSYYLKDTATGAVYTNTALATNPGGEADVL